MADRVKYFLLGVLFLVVAGVIAYDRWNSAGEPQEVADHHDADTGDDIDFSKTPESLKVEPETKKPQDPTPAPYDPAPPSFEEKPTPAPFTPPVTPPRVDRKTEPPPAPPAPDKTHVIKKGETLEAIAMRYYGTREGIQWIASANRLDNTNRIYANQKLIIPAKKEIAKETTTKRPAAEKSDDKIPSRYRVQKGDNLYAISRRFYGTEGQGARVNELMKLNHLWSATLKEGTVLILPPR